MSSHHFVREGQEPALFIADALSLAHAEPLLEWAPLVIVTEDAADEVLQWGIKIDVVLARPGHTQVLTDKLAHQQPLEIIYSHQHEDLLTAAVALLTRKQATAVNVLVGAPDKWFAIDPTVLTFQVTLLTPGTRWSLIAKGPYEKWLSKNSTIRVHPDRPAQTFSTTGLTGQQPLFEALQDGVVSVRSAGSFWIGEPI